MSESLHTSHLCGPAVLEPVPPADHLVQVSANDWAFWRWAGLRAAGFPASMVMELAGETCVSAADPVFQAEEILEAITNEVRAVLGRELDGEVDESRRKLLIRMIRHVKKGRLPLPGDASAEPWYGELARAHGRRDECRKDFLRHFQSEALEISRKIRKITADPGFRQAVLLQNRNAFRLVSQGLAREADPGKRGSKERQRQELIASYLQRYCMKNDTIGFFGPMGWARLCEDGAGVTARPGKQLIAAIEVYFENWGIESLADSFSQNKGVRPWIPPRLSPFLHLEGSRLHSPGGIVSQLTPGHAAILSRCRGEKTACQIAREVVAMPQSGMRTEAQVFAALDFFVSRKVISWKFEIPLHAHPEQLLAGLLQGIEDDEVRLPALAALAQLETARAGVRAAIGDTEQLDRALGELDELFTRLTEQASSRAAGTMYAGRTLIYPDSRRDMELEIGSDVLRSLEKPLSLLLKSARWLSYRAACAYRVAYRQAFESLRRRNPAARIDLVQFWLEVEAITIDATRRLFCKIQPEFQRRWDEILKLNSGVSRLNYSSEELEARVEAAFAAPKAGWQLARYHSPDLMIAAASVDAIGRGDYSLVLGEIHVTSNTLRQTFSLEQHPRPQELLEAARRDHPEPRVFPIPPRKWPRITNRTIVSLRSPADYLLEVSPDAAAPGPRDRTYPISAFVVEEDGTELVVRSRDGKLCFDIIEFCGEILSGQATEFVKIIHHGRHTPRITIDRLTISREAWSFAGSELQFIHEEDEAYRYLEARRWMKSQGLPRFTFAKAASEVKPCYVDWESPIYVEIFIKMVRRQLASEHADAPIVISEMFPAPDQLWLPDAEGRVYTSELRIVARDMIDPGNSLNPAS